MKTNTQLRRDYVAGLVALIPQATADRDYLVDRVLPRMTTRAIKAMLDALHLAQRNARLEASRKPQPGSEIHYIGCPAYGGAFGSCQCGRMGRE